MISGVASTLLPFFDPFGFGTWRSPMMRCTVSSVDFAGTALGIFELTRSLTLGAPPDGRFTPLAGTVTFERTLPTGASTTRPPLPSAAMARGFVSATSTCCCVAFCCSTAVRRWSNFCAPEILSFCMAAISSALRGRVSTSRGLSMTESASRNLGFGASTGGTS